MIFVLIGKSASGKNTVYSNLLNSYTFVFKEIIPYTTRPMRDGEVNGKDYHFVTKEEYEKYEIDNKIIESRTYYTIKGIWNYFTVDEDIIYDKLYLTIGTLESFKKIKEYYKDKTEVIPIYVYTSDKIRLQRAIDREESNLEPDYVELCRRFVSDNRDFSKKKIEETFKDCKYMIYYSNDEPFSYTSNRYKILITEIYNIVNDKRKKV